MYSFSRLKKLRKRLRRNIKRLSVMIMITMCTMAIYSSWPVFFEQANASFEIPQLNSNETTDVFIVRRYLCGEETIYRGRYGEDEIERISKDKSLSFGWADDDRLYYIEQVDDLSSDCKKSAYFGLDPDGNFSLFNGLPEKKRVIRTFFQLDIEHLESSLPYETVKQLYEGIRISDFNEYNSVLSTFSPYAIE